MYWHKEDWADADLAPVTTLADSGPGSLREALESYGKRIIVFAVSGVITVKEELDIDDPFCWVCGYTAGHDGVILVGDGSVDSIVNVNTSDVILQGLTILCNNSGEGTRSLSVADRGNRPSRILLQNLSTGVSEDENVIIWYDTRDVCYKECISAFSLLPDGKGPNLGSEDGGNYWVERNIFYGHRQRLPRTKANGAPIYLVNNLAMNHQGSGASVKNSDGCNLYAYGNIDWQPEGSADYFISTESDSPVFHNDNWLIRGERLVDSDVVKHGKGTRENVEFDYIKSHDELLATLRRVSGNKMYLDADYKFHERIDPFTEYVHGSVGGHLFDEVRSDYDDLMPFWADASDSMQLDTEWNIDRLVTAALERGVVPEPPPPPDPEDPPPPDPPSPPADKEIVERLERISQMLAEVVEFTRQLKGALR